MFHPHRQFLVPIVVGAGHLQQKVYLQGGLTGNMLSTLKMESERWTESLIEWEQIHTQQENGKWSTGGAAKDLAQQALQRLGTGYCKKKMDTIIL